MLDLFDEREMAAQRQRYYGVYAAKVKTIKNSAGSVEIELPWAPDNDDDSYHVWARLSVLMAGGNRGTWFVPDVGDEVLVAFEGGDPRRPYVIGALWNGKDKPPETMDAAGNNNKKTIRSRKGVLITLDDTDGKETLTLATPGGQSITLTDGPASIQLKDANNNSIKLDASGITITTSAQFTVQAGTIQETAGQVTVNAALAAYSGVIQSNVCQSTSIIGITYTPGAGNIL